MAFVAANAFWSAINETAKDPPRLDADQGVFVFPK